MTTILGLVGHPVAHSLSPRMHAVWIDQAGLDAVYLPFEVAPDTSGEAIVAAIRTLGLAGVNLTVPFKERVLPHLDTLDPAAGRIGAVNTVVARKGQLHGLNTDAPGFVAAVQETGVVLSGSTVVVLGAGGAARAVVAGVAEAGAARVVVLNRTESRAQEIAARIGEAWPRTRMEGGALARFRGVAPDATVIVNAVSGAGRPAIAALDPVTVGPDALWVDLNYWDSDPPLLGILAKRGVATQGGLPMLIHQGALAFEAFTGAVADRSSARDALRAGIRA